MNVLYSLKKRHIALLEVLIAFALVALCILPLIYPHVFILRSEKKFTSTVELDHLINLLYADRLQKLYQNEISWQQIESGHPMPVDAALLQAVGYTEPLPYDGTYRFINKRKRPAKPVDKVAYLFELEFTFVEKPQFFLEKIKEGESSPKITYTYLVPIERVVE